MSVSHLPLVLTPVRRTNTVLATIDDEYAGALRQLDFIQEELRIAQYRTERGIAHLFCPVCDADVSPGAEPCHSFAPQRPVDCTGNPLPACRIYEC